MYTDSEGRRWYKGNLHMHTTQSDGRKTPAEALSLYRDAGYDFVSVTDHWIFGESSEYRGMLVLPGAEYDTVNTGVWHILGIGASRPPKCSRGALPQEFADAINDAGGIAVLAHPAWSMDDPRDMAALRGIAATEIYNSVSGYPFGVRPYSGELIDVAARQGFYTGLTASDDAHFYNGDQLRGFVYVNADELSHAAITDALRQGRYYASNGPVIESVSFDGSVITVASRGARGMQLFTSLPYLPGATVSAPDGETVDEGKWSIPAGISFARAEVMGDNGKRAYTGFIIANGCTNSASLF